MNLQTNNALQEQKPSHFSHKTIQWNNSFYTHNDGLSELRNSIDRLEDLNGRLKYMMTEIHSLITNN